MIVVAYLQWLVEDPVVGDSYTFPVNPNQWSGFMRARSFTVQETTALDGNMLVYEGQRGAADASFGGVIRSRAQYDSLMAWFHASRGRLVLSDHFGRKFGVQVKGIEFESPERPKPGIYWYKRYTVSLLILSGPTAPTVGDV